MQQVTGQEKKFKEERVLGLGSSDASTAAGVSKFGCLRALQYEKRSVPPDFPKDESGPIERGTLLEPVGRELYKKRTGRIVLVILEGLQNRTHPWMRAHLDGIVLRSNRDSERGNLEIKVPGRRRFQEFKKQGLDEDYILQMQHALAASGFTWGSFAVLCLEPWDFLWFDVQRDEAMIERLIEIEGQVWARIQNGPWYDRLDAKDRRCGSCQWRKTCQGQDFIPEKEKGEFESDDSLIPLLERVREADEIAGEAADLKELTRNDLKAALGDRQGAIIGGVPVYYKEFPVERWETKELTAEFKRNKLFASLMAKYKKISKQRALRYFGSKEQ